MSSYRDIFNSRENQNWLKARLAMQITKLGIQNLVNDDIETIQSKILQSVLKDKGLPESSTCNGCTTPAILQCPSPHGGCKSHNCRFHETHKYRPCPNNICDNFRERIIELHRFKRPSFRNTDASKWCSVSWELAKCFLPPDGYSTASCIEETDFNGVINILINCKLFQRKFSFIVSQTPNLLTEVRDIGKDIRHSPNLSVTDNDLKRYLDSLTTLLSDTKYLCVDNNAKESLEKLNQLRNDSLRISSDDIVKIIVEAKLAIDDGQEQIKKLLLDAETRLQKYGVAILRVVNDEASESFTGLKLAFKEDLTAFNLKRHSSISIFPLVPNKDAGLEHIFVTPDLYEVEFDDPDILPNLQKRSGRKIDTYAEIFSHGGDRKQDIYLIGKAGMGKTSLCKRMALDWCRQKESDTKVNIIYQRKEETDYSLVSFSDIVTLSQFNFFFLVPLRDAQGVLCDVDDMIKHQIIKQLPRSKLFDDIFLEKLLFEESCLIVLDGLDEWKHPEIARYKEDCHIKSVIPHRKVRNKCTILTTSRPWKIDNICLEKSQIDREVEIRGFEYSSSRLLIENVTKCLNNTYGKCLDSSQFVQKVYKKTFTDLVSIPIVLMQLLSLWFEGVEVGNSKCQIYCNMIEMILIKGQERSPQELAEVRQDIDMDIVDLVPNLFQSKPMILACWSLVISLAKLAFHTLCKGDDTGRLVFDRDIVKKCITESQILAALEIGIISQRDKVSAVSLKQSSFTFLHKTYQEMFCAIYVCMNERKAETVLERLSKHVNEQSTSTHMLLLGVGIELNNIALIMNFMAGISYGMSETLLKAIEDCLSKALSRMRLNIKKLDTEPIILHYQIGSLVQRLNDITLDARKKGKQTDCLQMEAF